MIDNSVEEKKQRANSEWLFVSRSPQKQAHVSPITKQFMAETGKQEISSREEKLLNGVKNSSHASESSESNKHDMDSIIEK